MGKRLCVHFSSAAESPAQCAVSFTQHSWSTSRVSGSMLVAENMEMNGTPEGWTRGGGTGKLFGLSGPISFKSKDGACFYGAFPLCERVTGLADPTGGGPWIRGMGPDSWLMVSCSAWEFPLIQKARAYDSGMRIQSVRIWSGILSSLCPDHGHGWGKEEPLYLKLSAKPQSTNHKLYKIPHCKVLKRNLCFLEILEKQFILEPTSLCLNC